MVWGDKFPTVWFEDSPGVRTNGVIEKYLRESSVVILTEAGETVVRGIDAVNSPYRPYSTCKTWEELHRLMPGSLNGWMTAEERDYFVGLAPTLPPNSTVLEIGVFAASNLCLFGCMAPPTINLIVMDSWENLTPVKSIVSGKNIGLREAAVENLTLCDLIKRTDIHDGQSQLLGAEWDHPVTVCIVDGDHTFLGAHLDLMNFAKWVEVGGYLIVDDYWSTEDIRKAVRDWDYTPGTWRRVFGEYGEVRNEQGGLITKMIVLQRMS